MSHVKRMLISADPQEVRVAIVEGGKLTEAYIERRGRRSITGNIYKGRVDAVLPGMEAAFVDIGLPKNGFLYVDEIVLPELEGARSRSKKQIQDMIKPGQELLVQVTKDPMGTKGARLTMDVSLAGRFMVLAPGGDGVGVSKKLPDGERDRLRKLLKEMMTEEDAGLIARTAAQGASLDELERDVDLLEKLWSVTRKHAQEIPAPTLVYAEPDLSLQMIRDDLRDDVSEVVIDDDRQHERVLAYVRRTSPELADRIKLYRGKRSLFSRYEIEQGIRSTLQRRVDLPSGGSLIVDYGEAFTVIDVNTGRFTGSSRKLEDTILKNNLEASVEVCRQLRLRDIGGIIVVDFIDMSLKKHRDAVLESLQQELAKDRSKVYLVDVSPLGLVELTRKNVADGVREIMTEVCPHCTGTGRVLSDETLAIDNLRELRQITRESKSEAFEVEMHDDVARVLIGAGGIGLDELEGETERSFTVIGRTGVPRTHFAVIREGSRADLGTDEAPCAPGDVIELPLVEPHRFAEADAIARLRAGYEVQVVGGLPYVGQTQRVRIERATRFSAVAELVDAEPLKARPAPRPVHQIAGDDDGDHTSDILEPERTVGERVDVEGRLRRQKKRDAAEERRDRRKDEKKAPVRKARTSAPATVGAEEGEGAPDDDEPLGDDGQPRKRRRRRGGRGRRGRSGASDALGTGEEAGDAAAVESPNGAVAAPADETAPAPKPRRRRAPAKPAAAAPAVAEQEQPEAAAKPVRRRRAATPAAAAPEAAGDAAPAVKAPRRRRTAASVAEASSPAESAPEAPSPREPVPERRAGLLSRILGRDPAP